MMDWLIPLIISLPVLVWVGIVGVIIYLIVRRVKSKSEETFEQRDN